MAERLTVISSDAHAGLPTAGYRDYLEAKFHPELDSYLTERRKAFEAGAVLGAGRKNFASFTRRFLEDFINEEQRATGGPTGGWDFDVRRKELDADGVVAEAIFPGPVNVDIETSIPFQGRAFFGDSFTADRSLDAMWAGARAYNRWLADVMDPARQAGLVLVPTLSDMDQVCREIAWAAEHRFKGVIVRQYEDGLPLLHDVRYEPLWAACAEHELPIHFHGGVGQPADVTSSPVGPLVSAMETAWWGYRPLWQLMWAGAYERYPNLKTVFTEVHAGWAPSMIDMLDVRYEDPWLWYGEALREKPSVYWHRQCYIGAAFLSRAEVACRDLIGEDRLMYGNDYPHVEGIWPRSRQYLHEVFAGQSPDVVRRLVGENAAALYNFDLDLLNGFAAEVGPLMDEVIGGSPSPATSHPTDRMAARAARPLNWVMGAPPRTFRQS